MSDHRFNVLSIIPDAGEAGKLRQIADNEGWRLRVVSSPEQALAVLREYPAAVVICDRDLPGDDWREVLRRIYRLPQPPSVLLASDVSDDYLWQEVVQHHGYDVLVKPFRREEVVRAVHFASSWRGWIHRHRVS